MSIARLKVLGSTHKNSRLIFMCASGDTVYASENREADFDARRRMEREGDGSLPA